jgi:hypothetical protein
VVTVWLAAQFLHGLPTAGNDTVLEASLALTGAVLGVLAGLATTVHRHGEEAFAKAGVVAAALWVAGIGARTAFSIWVTHGGQASVAGFSASHHITTASAWVRRTGAGISLSRIDHGVGSRLWLRTLVINAATVSGRE